MTKYQIIDWAGNVCLFGFTFNSFEDADSAIGEFIESWLGSEGEEDYNEERGEYSIITKR